MNIKINYTLDLDLLTEDQVRLELAEWRKAAPSIMKMVNELSLFKQYSGTVEELDARIVALDAKHKATIELRDKQIQELMEVIRQYQADPIGVGQHIEKLANTKLKMH